MRVQFEYRAVPAPRKGKSARGLRGTEAKFANAFSSVMNEMGAEGWEYLRADTLPCEERQGLTGKTIKYHSMLVFRRPVAEIERDISEATEILASLSAPAAIAVTPAIAAPAAISEDAGDPPISAPERDVASEDGEDHNDAPDPQDEDDTGDRSTVAAE